MLVSVVPIGNSKGVRLPKAILEQLEITEKVDLEVENDQIVLKPIKKKPRSGWEDEFRKMAENNDDAMLIVETSLSEGFEWEW